VTQEEYERLRLASTLHGDRALSSYAREATLLAARSRQTSDLNQIPGAASETQDLIELSRRLSELESKVEGLRLPHTPKEHISAEGKLREVKGS